MSATASSPYVGRQRARNADRDRVYSWVPTCSTTYDREQAAELRRALASKSPRQGGQEAGPEGVAHAGRLDLPDLRDRGRR